MVGDLAARTVRGARERYRAANARDSVDGDHCVAGRVYALKVGASVRIDHHRAALADDSRGLEHCGVRTNTDREHNKVSFEPAPVAEHDDIVIGALLDCLCCDPGTHLDPEPAQFGGHSCGDLPLQGWQHVRREFDQVDLKSLQAQSLSSFNSDEARTEHHCTQGWRFSRSCGAALNALAQRDSVGYGA